MNVRSYTIVCVACGTFWQTFKYNTLETLYLGTAMFILLSGACSAYLQLSEVESVFGACWKCVDVCVCDSCRNNAGMAFQSGVAAVGSAPHVILTWLVAFVLVACILLFFGMVVLEVWRSVQFARRVHAMRSAPSKVGRANTHRQPWTENPMARGVEPSEVRPPGPPPPPPSKWGAVRILPGLINHGLVSKARAGRVLDLSRKSSAADSVDVATH